MNLCFSELYQFTKYSRFLNLSLFFFFVQVKMNCSQLNSRALLRSLLLLCVFQTMLMELRSFWNLKQIKNIKKIIKKKAVIKEMTANDILPNQHYEETDIGASTHFTLEKSFFHYCIYRAKCCIINLTCIKLGFTRIQRHSRMN